MVGRSARVIGLRLEAQTRKVQFIDEDIDHPNRAVFCNVVVESFRK